MVAITSRVTLYPYSGLLMPFAFCITPRLGESQRVFSLTSERHDCRSSLPKFSHVPPHTRTPYHFNQPQSNSCDVKQENVYPIGPSVQFYRMFLDPVVREDLEDYDALAIIEWDVVVAHPSSFHRLHEAAFTNSEPFWVKGSTLAGVSCKERSNNPD